MSATEDVLGCLAALEREHQRIREQLSRIGAVRSLLSRVLVLMEQASELSSTGRLTRESTCESTCGGGESGILRDVSDATYAPPGECRYCDAARVASAGKFDRKAYMREYMRARRQRRRDAP